MHAQYICMHHIHPHMLLLHHFPSFYYDENHGGNLMQNDKSPLFCIQHPFSSVIPTIHTNEYALYTTQTAQFIHSCLSCYVMSNLNSLHSTSCLLLLLPLHSAFESFLKKYKIPEEYLPCLVFVAIKILISFRSFPQQNIL